MFQRLTGVAKGRVELEEKTSMGVDIVHILITIVAATVLYYALEHFRVLEGKSKLTRSLITGIVLFVVLLALNLVWPYGHFL